MPDPITAIGGILSAGGALISSRSASSAADAQTEAANQAAQVQWQMYNQNRADLAPWREAGRGALEALWGTPGTAGTPATPGTAGQGPAAQVPGAGVNPDNILAALQSAGLVGSVYQSAQSLANYLYGLGAIPSSDPTAAVNYMMNYVSNQSPQAMQQVAYIRQTAGGVSPYAPQQTQGTAAVPGTPGTTGMIQKGPGEFKESPSYQFTLGEGLKGIQRAASATGRLASGDYIKDATKYAEGLASTEYQNFLNRYYQSLEPYFRIAGYGQSAATTGTAAGTSTGNALAQTYLAGGQAQAAGNLGAAYPWSQLANYGATQLGQYGMNQAYGNQNSLANYWAGNQYTPANMNAMSWL